MHPHDSFKRLFEVYCAVVSGMDVSHVTFLYNGNRMHGLATPKQLGVRSGDIIQVKLAVSDADARATASIAPPKGAASFGPSKAAAVKAEK